MSVGSQGSSKRFTHSSSSNTAGFVCNCSPYRQLRKTAFKYESIRFHNHRACKVVSRSSTKMEGKNKEKEEGKGTDKEGEKGTEGKERESKEERNETRDR